MQESDHEKWDDPIGSFEGVRFVATPRSPDQIAHDEAQWDDWVDRMIAAADYEDGTEGVWDYSPNDPLHMRLHTRPVEHPDVVRVKYGKDISITAQIVFRSLVANGMSEERAAGHALVLEKNRRDMRPYRG